MSRILGVSAYYHDAAAALLVDGDIAAAAQEERFTRRKHDARFPAQAVAYCLAQANCRLREIDSVVFYDQPGLKSGRLWSTFLAFAPLGFDGFAHAAPNWLTKGLVQRRLLRRELRRIDPAFDADARLHFVEHHLSHAASAFYPSPFDRAIVLCMDGVGEWATTTASIGDRTALRIEKEIRFPHSLGLLYSAFTSYTGFKVNSGEYKLMGLAPYGEARFRDLILDNLLDLKEDGSFRLDQSFFNYCTGLGMTNRRFAELFGQPARPSEGELTTFHMDVAASIQAVTEEVVLRLSRGLQRDYGLDRLCLAGGVALNCVANGRILRDGTFKEIWIQPAAGDAGGALGAALIRHYAGDGVRRTTGAGDRMQGAYLGPAYGTDEITAALDARGAVYRRLDEKTLLAETSRLLADGKAVGWFQGRMEYGPRALGARSILADPRAAETQRRLNLKIKYRESFRPFAPAVLAEDAADYFDLDGASPYMLIVAGVQPARRRAMGPEDAALFGIDKLNLARSDIPAVTHVDYSARVQTVHRATNPRFHALIRAFKAQTGCSVLVNTSFNIRGEPIVCTPEDAFTCFMGTDMEALAIGDCLLLKAEQDPALATDYRNRFAPD